MVSSVLKIDAAQHPIKSVTVFKSAKAEIVRTFSLDLKKGQNKVDITGISSWIDTESARVSGLGDARLFDVVCTIDRDGDPDLSPASSAETVRLLNVTRSNLENEKRVRQHEADFLVDYAKTLSGEHVSPSQMNEFLGTFVEQGRKNLDAVHAIDERIVEIDRQIEKERKRAALKKGEAHGKVTVVISTEEAATAELRLTYLVSQVTWTPTYELHATLENGKPSPAVSLQYRARVQQSSGEDWNDVTLTLSTVASDTVAKSVPHLRSLKIRPRSLYSNWNSNNWPQKGGGLFGQQNNANNSHSAFGSAPQMQQQQMQQQQMQQQQLQQRAPSGLYGQPAQSGGFAPVGSLFSSHPSNPPVVASTGVGLFGGSVDRSRDHDRHASPPSAPDPPSFGAFGATSSTTAPAPAGGLFGSGLPGGTSLFGAAAPAEGNSEADDAFEALPSPAPFSEPATVVTESPLAIAYSVDGATSIPSDGVSHQVAVAVLPFEAKVAYVAVPRIEARVYLQCTVKNTSDYRLLPGLVNVFLDDSFVSKTTIQDINTGDTFDCTLGTDSSTLVTYSRTSKTIKTQSGAFSEQSNTTTYTRTTTVHNKHRFPLADLFVRDCVPLTDDKRVQVVLRKPAGLADAKEAELDVGVHDMKVRWSKAVDSTGGEKEGRFEWFGQVKPGGKITLLAEWEVKGPADTFWVEALN